MTVTEFSPFAIVDPYTGSVNYDYCDPNPCHIVTDEFDPADERERDGIDDDEALFRGPNFDDPIAPVTSHAAGDYNLERFLLTTNSLVE